MDERKILFQGEMQIVAWGDSSTSGPWVKLWVHPDDLEQFKLLRVRKGNKEAGTRLATVMVEIGDDEAAVTQHEEVSTPASTPAPSPKPRAYHPPAIGDLAMVAVLWCKDPVFHNWLFNEEADDRWLKSVYARGLGNEQAAKEWILEVCGLVAKHGTAASRKHLDTDPEAAALFHERIRIPFRDYRNEHGLNDAQ